MEFYGAHYSDCMDAYTGKMYTLVIAGESQLTNFKTGEKVPANSITMIEKETGEIVKKPFYFTRVNVTVKFKNGHITTLKPGEVVFYENEGFKVIAEYNKRLKEFIPTV